MIKRLFAIVTSVFLFLIVFPVIVFAATNYGEGTYGEGVYNVGATAAPAASVSNSTSTSTAATCGDSASVGAPNLFEVRTTKNSATLFFAPPVMPYSNFYVAFSRKADVWEYGTQYNQGYSGGVLQFTVNLLSPNTKYYFKIRSGNGCATGSWSNTMVITTNQRTYYKNLTTAVSQIFKSIVNKPAPTSVPSYSAPAIVTGTPQAVPQTATQTPQKKTCILWWCF